MIERWQTMSDDLYWEDIPDKVFTSFQERLLLVELLTDDTIPFMEKVKLKQEYQDQHQVSERTLRRYVQLYKHKGELGLLFYSKRKTKERINDPLLREKILELIRELPERSIPKLRRLLSIDAGYRDKISCVSDRTLYRFLSESGFGKKDRRALLAHTTGRQAYKSFEASYSLELVQGDARDGIWLPGMNGKARKTYLFLWVDDYSRKILFGKYYDSEKLPCMEDSFKYMVLRYGIPKKIYLDNGSVYISKHFAFVLLNLNTKKIHHKPYQSWCKGKIEVKNKIVKYDFQTEAECAGMKTIEELNTAFWAWCELCHNKTISSATGQCPDDRFLQGLPKDHRRIEDIAHFESLFLWRENRKISKYGKIKLYNNEYPVSKKPYGTVVQVRFNPCDLREVYIYDQNNSLLETTWPSKQLSITAPDVPEEKDKSKARISIESQKYFAQLREEYLEQQKRIATVDFSQFYTHQKENKDE
jgi:putative transposase